MRIDDHKRANRSVNVNQSDDDDYEDNGSGIEDDAPEGFQAVQRPEQAIITFPDLLRVPTTTANMGPEDDSPESLSFASVPGQPGQPVRPNELHMPGPSAGQRPAPTAPTEPIGGLPRNRRPLSHPDVSQMSLSPTPNASSGSIPNPSVASNSFEPTARPLPPLPVSDQNPSVQGSSSLDPQGLAPILSAITRIQASVETLNRNFNERLDSMENRINEMTSVNIADNLANLNQMSPDFLRNFIQEQKREMHNQRRSFVLSFAEALRFAADPPNQNGSQETPNPSNHNRSRP